MRTLCSLSLALCLLPSLALGTEPCIDTVFAEVIHDTVEVYHEGAFYNCCAVMDFSLQMGDTTVDIVETETFPTGPCHCMCCFDLHLSIGGLLPGAYWVSVWNEDKSVLYGKIRVVVGAHSSGQPEISEFWQSDCYTQVPGSQRDLPPTVFMLAEPVPNPTEGPVRLHYQLAKQGPVSIQVFDSSGRAVSELVDAEQQSGRHSIRWDAKRFPSGVYFIRLAAGPKTAIRKLVIAR